MVTFILVVIKFSNLNLVFERNNNKYRQLASGLIVLLHKVIVILS